MNEGHSPAKTTPSRRKQGRASSGRPAGAHKAYASENDAVALDPSRQHLHHDTPAPQTPSKVTGPQAAADSAVTDAGTKQRSRARQKNKQAPASPDSAQRDRRTPPQTSVSSRPGNSTAFAGATFHASPAPSALPMPSFLAKPSAEEPSPPATDTDAPTPFRPSSVPRNHESPLDFMFRAHREERERLHRGSSTDVAITQPEIASPSYHAKHDLTPSSDHQATQRMFVGHLSGGMDSFELNSTPGRPLGPAFSTPYQERINAARSSSSRTHPNRNQKEYQQKSQPPDDPTEALKKFLFSGGPASDTAPKSSIPASPTASLTQPGDRPQQPPPPNPPQQGTPHASLPHLGYQSQQRQPPGHSQPASSEAEFRGHTQGNEFQAMENDLRRILKLDLVADSSSDGGVFSL